MEKEIEKIAEINTEISQIEESPEQQGRVNMKMIENTLQNCRKYLAENGKRNENKFDEEELAESSATGIKNTTQE